MDLIAIEKELTQAQGEIETIATQQNYLRTRTDTIRVDINYQGVIAQAGGIDFSPIQQSVRGAGRTIVESVAWLIGFIVATLPWVPVIALTTWATRRGIRRWRARRAQA